MLNKVFDMALSFDLRQIYFQAFGITSRSFEDVEAIERAEADRESVMGTPIFMPCTLGDLELPNEPLISIQGRKNIVETDVTDLRGTVKEIISNSDYDITIRGVIVNDVYDFPEEMLRSIRALCETNESLAIDNRFCSVFNIDQVVIKDYQFREMEGFLNAQPYEIRCVSDEEAELEIIEETEE